MEAWGCECGAGLRSSEGGAKNEGQGVLERVSVEHRLIDKWKK